MMTKQDYEVVAGAVREGIMYMALQPGARAVLESFTVLLAFRLLKQNPAFNVKKFMAAALGAERSIAVLDAFIATLQEDLKAKDGAW